MGKKRMLQGMKRNDKGKKERCVRRMERREAKKENIKKM